jgi:uncharacterized protein YeeX (DUF496 family)
MIVFPMQVLHIEIFDYSCDCCHGKRSFSKLKLLMSYMRTTMTLQRLNDLATISLESEVLEKIDYEDLIEDFISKNTKRMMLLK